MCVCVCVCVCEVLSWRLEPRTYPPTTKELVLVE